MKCASIDSPTKIRTESAFNNHKAIQEEKTINVLTRLEQKVNEARNHGVRISDRKFSEL